MEGEKAEVTLKMLANVGYDNQSYHILTVNLNQIKQLWIPWYNLFSSTLFYTNVSIYTAIWGRDKYVNPMKVGKK